MDRLYECMSCGEHEIVKENEHRIDGRKCKECGGHSGFRGFVGVDFGKGPDFSVERQVRQMDYKSVIEEQVRELQKTQDSISKKTCDPAMIEAACNVAKTIEYLCEAAARWTNKKW